jgi:hypothetical protein
MLSWRVCVVALQVDDFTVDMHVTHSFRTHYPQSLSLSRVQSLPVSSSLRVDGGGHHEHHAGRTTSLNLRLHDSAAAAGGSGTQISEVDSDTGSDLSYVKVGSEVAATRQVRETHTPTHTEIACCQTRQNRPCALPGRGVRCRRPGGRCTYVRAAVLGPEG